MKRPLIRRMSGYLIAVVVVTFHAPAVRAEGAAKPADLSADLRPLREKHGLPAMAAVVVRGDRVIAVGAEGVRKAGGKDRVTAADRFHVGSNTKSMTATLCALLVEEGKLKWDTTLADAFPDLKGKMHEQWRGVTLEQLLTNRGGAPADLDADGLWGRLWAVKGTPTVARRTLLEGVIKNPPAAEPGTKYVYSNAGFAIAGHLAEKAAGKPWEQLMRDRLFKPLGMTTAGFGAPAGPRGVGAPLGHEADGKPKPPGPGDDNPPAIAPAGLVHCSMGDYGKYLALHLRGAKGEAKLLKPETFRRLHAPAGGPGARDNEKYAMGWIVGELPGAGPLLAHDGSNGLWYCTAWVLPDMDLAVAVAVNQGGEKATRACYEAAQALAQRFDAKGKGRP